MKELNLKEIKMKFLIGSDIVPTECTEQLFVEGDTEKLFGKINGLAKDMDRIIINLECALTDYDGAVSADPEEAEEIKWVSYEELAEDLRTVPERYTVWFRIAAPEVLSQLNAGRDQHIHRKEGEG